MTNRDPVTNGPAERGWSAATIAAVSIAVIVLLAAISYALNNPAQLTTAGASATTTGHDTGTGTAPARSAASGNSSR